MSVPIRVNNLQQLRELIQRNLDPSLLHKDFGPLWDASNPTFGFCSVASEAAWFVLGGGEKGWVACTARDSNNIVHWWLRHSSGLIFDPTEEQYTSQNNFPPYQTGASVKATGFMGVRVDANNEWGFSRKPSARAQRLLNSMVNDLKKKHVPAY